MLEVVETYAGYPDASTSLFYFMLNLLNARIVSLHVRILGLLELV